MSHDNACLKIPHQLFLRLMVYDVLVEAVKIVEAQSVGLTEPGRWGHWYQGHDPVKRAIVAASKAAREARREENKNLAWLCSDWQPENCLRGVERTNASLEHIKRIHAGDHWSQR